MEQKSVRTNGLWTYELSINGLSNSIMFEEFTIAESMARVGSYKKHYLCWIQEKNEQHNIYVIKNVALFLYRKAVGSQENKVSIKIN